MRMIIFSIVLLTSAVCSAECIGTKLNPCVERIKPIENEMKYYECVDSGKDRGVCLDEFYKYYQEKAEKEKTVIQAPMLMTEE